MEDLDIVALQEMIKHDFSDYELKEMAGPIDFQWIWAPARGQSGGLITGVKSDEFEIEQSTVSTYFLAVLVRNRKTNHMYWVMNVYGPAHHNMSEGFILDIKDFCAEQMLPILMGGDFNLIWNNNERNQGQGDPRLMTLFNYFIGDLQLREIFISGVKFTWSNKQQQPTLIKLDRILASSCWDIHYSCYFSWSKAWIGSNHSPLFLDTREKKR